ncbi:hypothetical protein pb186bvf_011214 [Paramecium bursaria]
MMLIIILNIKNILLINFKIMMMIEIYYYVIPSHISSLSNQKYYHHIIIYYACNISVHYHSGIIFYRFQFILFKNVNPISYEKKYTNFITKIIQKYQNIKFLKRQYLYFNIFRHLKNSFILFYNIQDCFIQILEICYKVY